MMAVSSFVNSRLVGRFGMRKLSAWRAHRLHRRQHDLVRAGRCSDAAAVLRLRPLFAAGHAAVRLDRLELQLASPWSRSATSPAPPHRCRASCRRWAAASSARRSASPSTARRHAARGRFLRASSIIALILVPDAENVGQLFHPHNQPRKLSPPPPPPLSPPQISSIPHSFSSSRLITLYSPPSPPSLHHLPSIFITFLFRPGLIGLLASRRLPFLPFIKINNPGEIEQFGRADATGSHCDSARSIVSLRPGMRASISESISFIALRCSPSWEPQRSQGMIGNCIAVGELGQVVLGAEARAGAAPSGRPRR